ncbi:outer membrane protein transport protein [Vibrio maerlii]|uniref:outer membrane protein transport protein n=1 Tax=Vibrio maerlii TaxID=2231648 RepID=UPI000E3E3C0C|nr:outer membrane protein transport protein [Vibrio maerlii]
MSHKFNFAKSALLIGSALAAANVNAAGFQLNAQSATGIGRAFAGDAVIADNASVMARNPAAMALFDEPSLSLGFETIITDISVTDGHYKGFTKTETVATEYNDAGGASIAPNIHYIHPINEKFALGINLYSNFGTSTEFKDSRFVGSEYGGKTDIMSLNLGVSGSYRLNKQWSVGAGLDLIYGKGELERNANLSIGGGTFEFKPCDFCQPQEIPLPEFTSELNALKAEADGIGLGFNIGTVYELNENNRFGLSYRYSPEIEAEGDIEFVGTKYDTLTLPLPDMAELSGYHHIDNTKFALHYSVQWTGWGVFKTLDANGPARKTLNEYHWKDGFHYSIGGTYYLNSNWTLRAGYMYDESAQDELTSISVPDSDRQWFSTGFTYHINSKSDVDFGFTYLMGKDVEVSEETDLGVVSTITGTTRANAILVGLQYSRTF